MSEEEILPSSGFAASVMEAVRREAATPPPIPFPLEAGAAGSSDCCRNTHRDPCDLHDEALRFKFFRTRATGFGFNVAVIASGSLTMGIAGPGGCAGWVEDDVISWTSQKLIGKTRWCSRPSSSMNVFQSEEHPQENDGGENRGFCWRGWFLGAWPRDTPPAVRWPEPRGIHQNAARAISSSGGQSC